MLARLLALTLALMLLAACAPGSNEQAAREATLATLAPTMRGPAPDLALSPLDGPATTLAAWRGQGIVLNFWATWCVPCRTEMPALAAAHEQNPDVVVIGVNYQETPEAARAFVDELALPFPILLDEGALADALRVRALPATFFIDPEGNIVDQHLGPLTESILNEKIARLRAP